MLNIVFQAGTSVDAQINIFESFLVDRGFQIWQLNSVSPAKKKKKYVAQLRISAFVSRLEKKVTVTGFRLFFSVFVNFEIFQIRSRMKHMTPTERFYYTGSENKNI